MDVVVASHPSAFAHDTGAGHPESPERAQAAKRGIEAAGAHLVEIVAPEVAPSTLALAHDASYIDMIEKFCSLGGGALDMDTIVSTATWQAALTAVGGLVAVIDELAGRESATGFAVTRPPGHHAKRDRAAGFCVFNNVAVAAMLARSGGERVAILDWDVHHGNGTQEIVGADPGILYVSMHQDHHYPLTGPVSDIDGEAKGSNVNIPLPPGTAGDVFRLAWSEIVVPVVSQFAPDWIIVSAGYDAHEGDPLGDLMLTSNDFGWLAGRLASVHPSNRIAMALEGGYGLADLERSVEATVRGLTGQRDFPDSPFESPPGSRQAIAEAALTIERHWPLDSLS